MQILRTLLVLTVFLSFSSLNAQKSITEGVVKMEITDVSSDDQAIAGQLEMMKGTETIYSFNHEQSLVTSNMMGGMIKMESLTVNDSESTTMLFDMMGQKMMVSSTKEDRAEAEAQQKDAFKDIKMTYDENDTKEILGYKCIKAVASGEDIPFSFEMYVTTELNLDPKLIQGMQGLDLKGFPLEYEMKMDKMSMTYSATEMETEINSEIFNLNTEGYKKMTFKEFEEQMKGFGGGMGF